MAGDATSCARAHGRGRAADDLSLILLGEYRPCPQPLPREHAWPRQGVAVPQSHGRPPQTRPLARTRAVYREAGALPERVMVTVRQPYADCFPHRTMYQSAERLCVGRICGLRIVHERLSGIDTG